MSSKNSPILNIRRLLAKQESLFHISYRDGKPVKEKEPTEIELLNKELTPEKDRNFADATKAALYADTPKANAKKDRSINARQLNSLLESFNNRRNRALSKRMYEADLVATIDNLYGDVTTYKVAGGWEFTHNKINGTLISTKTPEGAIKMEFKSSKLKDPTNKGTNKQLIIEKIKEHLKRNKI